MEVFNKYIGMILDDRYKLEKTLGSGGMAMVFLAKDLVDGKYKAIKMLKENIANDPVVLQRFISESRAYSLLNNHSNIVTIYDISVKGEYKYLVMEYVQGITLKKYLTERGPLDWREVADFSIQILQALEVAHRIPVIHRDIKPQNIMLLPGGVVKVMDFGIAKLPNAQTLTMVDKAIGTVYYISPEQATGAQVSTTTDIYSLGIMMYEMVTGKLPYVAENQQGVIYKHLSAKPTPPSTYVPSIPKGFEQIILCAMEKKPSDRYASATQMIRHLKKILQDPSAEFSTKKEDKVDKLLETHQINKTSQQTNQLSSLDNTAPISSQRKKKKKDGLPTWLVGALGIVFVCGAVVGVVLIIGKLLG